MRAQLVAFPLFAALLLGATACTETVASYPIPVTPIPTTESTPAKVPLAELQPCDLLDSATIRQNNLSRIDSTPTDGVRTCAWSNIIVNNGEGFTADVDIYDEKGLSGINLSEFTSTEENIGDHSATQAIAKDNGVCFIFMIVSASSMVDVAVSESSDTNQACTNANKLAKAIEPKLP